jgi:GntR family transcriptional regulator
MPDDVIRPMPLYQQVADRLAEEIATGEYPPGSQLPSETQLMERYKVSRVTARAAVAALRTTGLTVSHQGRGNFVREVSTPIITVEQAIIRKGKHFAAYGEGQFSRSEPPSVMRAHATGRAAELLQRKDEAAAFRVDRLLTDPTTGLRALHRTLIPFDTAEQYPALATRPDTRLGEIFTLLTDAGCALTWREYVSARPALPDERAAIGGDAAYLLITQRVTLDNADRPLLVEMLSMDADRAQFARHLTAQRSHAAKS